ncbi:MAG: alternative ribosome rescue aminoacyl-tRNA hydrolase ArfB [Chloroflexota bacterium]
MDIVSNITVDESEIEFSFVRASGPGGQNVNKTSSAVQLRFDVVRSPSLPEDVRQRLITLAGSRMTSAGTLIIEAKRNRDQVLNRRDALDRLADLLRRAAQQPKARHKTRPTLASKQRRLDSKRRRSEIKRIRKEIE